MMLVCYDVATEDSRGEKRLRLVAKLCQKYGVRVQKSVFEVDVSSANFVRFRAELETIIDKSHDTVRIYVIQELQTEVAGKTGPTLDHSNMVL